MTCAGLGCHALAHGCCGPVDNSRAGWLGAARDGWGARRLGVRRATVGCRVRQLGALCMLVGGRAQVVVTSLVEQKNKVCFHFCVASGNGFKFH